MEGFDAARLEDMGVIAQAVVELRTVGLGINGLEFVVFDVGVMVRAVGFGIGVHAFLAAPDARHAGKRAEMGKGVRINGSFGIDVCGVFHAYVRCSR